MSPPVPELATELRETLIRVVRRMRAEPGPSIGRMAILARLDRTERASISDLATAERMRPQSMAQAVRDLEQAGLTSRRPDPDDGRRVLIELTANGRETLRATRESRDTWLTEVLERDFDAAERARLAEALALLGRIAES